MSTRVHTIHTITQVITLPPAEEKPDRVQIRKRPGPGIVLGGLEISPAKPLDAQSEAAIRSRLDALSAIGAEAKIRTLITQMRLSHLSEETHREMERWVSEFMLIDPIQNEDRSLSLAIFVFRFIRPALVRATGIEQEELLGLEDACRNILQQMLPGESVELFLEECEIGMREEKLLQEECARSDMAEEAQMDAFRFAARELDVRLEESCADLKRRLIAIQAVRRETHQTVSAEVEALAREVDLIRQQILVHAQTIAELGRQDNEDSRQVETSLAECKELLGRLKDE